MGAAAAAMPPASLGARPMLAFLNSLSGFVHLLVGPRDVCEESEYSRCSSCSAQLMNDCSLPCTVP